MRKETNKTIGGCVRTPCPDIFCRLIEAGTIFSWRGVSIWQLQWPQWHEASTLRTVATAKMSTPSRSRSLARGDKGYFEWRKTMERRQLESERQMQALLQETTRLREENAVLRIQVSSSGPPHDQRPRGQGANSRPNPESMYPGTTGVILDMCNEWSRE